jgi:hypothetical protein
VAMDEAGKPSFNLLQNYDSSKTPIFYYVFDLMVLGGRDVMGETLETRRGLLESKFLPKLKEPVRRGAHAQWVHAGVACGAVQKAEAAGGCGMSVREPAGEKGGTLGCWPHCGQNGGVPVVEAGACRPVRVYGMDAGGASAAQPVYGVADR